MIIGMNSKTATIEKTCPFCGCVSRAEVPTEGVGKYLKGARVQDAFPTCSVETREFIITGMCRMCQGAFYDEEE